MSSNKISRSVLLVAPFLLASVVAAQSAIATDGVIESTKGGFKFPDGSIQTGAAAPLGACPTLDPVDQMVHVGTVCIDKYEASVWSQPDGGTQYGVVADDYPCADDGQDCVGMIYARSVDGVFPSRYITWFQAQQALANSGKRLPTNAEWQVAMAGTPDPDASPGPQDCNSNSAGLVMTGARTDCVSDWGVNDMIGNLAEWVADWVPFGNACPGWGAFSNDVMCFAGASTTDEGPGAIIRSSTWASGVDGGAFSVQSTLPPTFAESPVGFRGAR